MSPELVVAIIAVGVAVGAFSAMFGVGGGTIMVPFIVFALSEDQHLAEGTSLLAIVPTAVAGVVAHRRRGLVSFRHALPIALGGIGGAAVGAWLALIMDADLLQAVFGAFVTVIGARLLLQGMRARRAAFPTRGSG